MSFQSHKFASAFGTLLLTASISSTMMTSLNVQASEVCFGTLSIAPGETISATRDGNYRFNGRCYSILECPRGTLSQISRRIFSCKDKDDIACTYQAYVGGSCSFKEHQAYKRNVTQKARATSSQTAQTSPGGPSAACSRTLTIKAGQGFKTNADNQFVYRNACYSQFRCANGDLQRVSPNSYVCYAQ